MQTTIESAPAEHLGHVPGRIEPTTGVCPVPAETESSYQGSRHHSRITHMALLIFVMVHGLQKVVNQPKQCYNPFVHGFLQRMLLVWLPTTIVENSWTLKSDYPR